MPGGGFVGPAPGHGQARSAKQPFDRPDPGNLGDHLDDAAGPWLGRVSGRVLVLNRHRKPEVRFPNAEEHVCRPTKLSLVPARAVERNKPNGWAVHEPADRAFRHESTHAMEELGAVLVEPMAAQAVRRKHSDQPPAVHERIAKVGPVRRLVGDVFSGPEIDHVLVPSGKA